MLYSILPATKMENGLDRSGLSRDPDVERKYSADPLVHSKISARMALDLFKNGDYIVGHAAEFPLPLLLMYGSGDYIINQRLIKEFASSAPLSKLTFKEWEGFYHELHNEPEKEQVFSTILNWMAVELK
jgi:alpha-beta hydrolase superfamily lysophospholipase